MISDFGFLFDFKLIYGYYDIFDDIDDEIVDDDILFYVIFSNDRCENRDFYFSSFLKFDLIFTVEIYFESFFLLWNPFQFLADHPPFDSIYDISYVLRFSRKLSFIFIFDYLLLSFSWDVCCRFIGSSRNQKGVWMIVVCFLLCCTACTKVRCTFSFLFFVG